MNDNHAIKVVLRRSDGKYLSGQEDAWSFTDELAEARVFDYVGDRIPEQLASLQNQCGLPLVAVATDPRERYELCDACGHRIMSFKALFDGQRYLCPECRRRQGENAL